MAASSNDERPLNALETLFASCNVRFAVLVAFPNSQQEKNTNVLVDQAKSAVESCRLGHIALKEQYDGKWTLVQSQSPHANVATENLGSNEEGCHSGLDNNYGDLLDEWIQKKTPPAEGPLSVQVLSSSSPSNLLLVNGNHAMVDGRSLTHFIGIATRMLEPSNAWKERRLPDWKDLVSDTVEPSTWQAEPPFLTGRHSHTLSFQDLAQPSPNTSTTTDPPSSTILGKDSFRWDLSGSTVTALRQVLKTKAPGATFSGFLAAIILQSLSQEYKGAEPRTVGISMLVDLRPHIRLSEPSQLLEDDQLPQAHGTVSLLESTESMASSEDTAATTTTSAERFVWDMSASLTQQLRHRIERGEAHRSAMAVTRGHFQEAGPSTTLELSNLGVVPIPDHAQLYTAQRFDGYDGVSCMVHSEGNHEGCMRWNVSVGEGIDAAVVERVFARSYNMCLKLAQC